MLKIHILNILKLLKTENKFFSLFHAAISNEETRKALTDYKTSSSATSREFLWDFFSTIDNIPSVNTIIAVWRVKEPNYKEIENNLENIPEKPYNEVIGQVIQTDDTTDSYKALIKHAQAERFLFHRVCLINTAENKLNYLFY